MDRKSTAIIALTVADFVALILVFIFNGVNGVENNGIFRNTITNVSNSYETDITPAGYTFSIWGLIYFWQSAWMLYALSGIFRRNSYGRVILNPVVLPIAFHAFWIASCVFNITWLFLWDGEHLFAAFFILLLFTLSGYTAVAVQSIETVKYEEQLRKEAKRDLICIYVLVQNGTDIIYSWTTVATMLNLSSALTYDPVISPNMSRSSSSTLALCLLLVVVIGWSVVENTVFFKFFRFVYAWYGVLIWASIGVLVKNIDLTNVNSILNILILCVAVICLCIKLAVFFYRKNSAPIGDVTNVVS